ncbi:family 43 glycosylhydrolase [Paenibacillus roseipurpureus]|uniref:Family 43 glycosylhydrolase n=1 Tax=Paenibacillus roseopurpureus TaxID=2918901 RepID=A0AA96LNH0_9BACL|nr:family 43 glycosylhydrolase [Paenibacillus sp. MBLB1832]WNR42958.1 family 43 glycosylhydrolase [Paenibacillus sp. MBLB1832]
MEKKHITVENPILPGDHPDPSVVRVGDDYYMVCSTFQFFPAVNVLHSRDLVYWRTIGHVVTRKEQLDLTAVPDSFGVYAPDISYYEGRFWVVVPFYHGQPRCTNILFSSEKPEGPYDNGTILNHHFIDPSIFNDEDGRRYLAFGGGWIHELAKDGSRLLGEAKQVWPGTGGAAPEAPHVLKRNGWYYLLLAEGGTFFEHRVTIARSRSIWGPYEPCPCNPILMQTDPNKLIQKTGHGKLIQDPQGRWWFPHLGGRTLEPVGSTPLGRETFLQPVSWTEDEWPVIGDGGKPLERFDIIDEDPTPSHLTFDFVDTFQSGELDPTWEWVRLPVERGFRLTNKGLEIDCKPYMLLTPQPTLVLTRRWQHFRFTAETELRFHPLSLGEEAGMLLYRDLDGFLMMSVRNGLGQTTGLPFDVKRLNENQEEEGLFLQIDRFEHAKRRTLLQKKLERSSGDPIRLRFQVDALSDYCMFQWAKGEGGSLETLDLNLPVSFLFPESAIRFLCFTAPRIALFARGVFGMNQGHALFTNFIYRGLPHPIE